MLLTFFLLAASQITGSSVQAPPPAPESNPPAVVSKPRSKPQAEAAVVAKFNALMAAMREFSSTYNTSHSVDARKARAVRQAWREFQTAQTQLNDYTGEK